MTRINLTKGSRQRKCPDCKVGHVRKLSLGGYLVRGKKVPVYFCPSCKGGFHSEGRRLVRHY